MTRVKNTKKLIEHEVILLIATKKDLIVNLFH